MLFACHRSQISGSVLCSLMVHSFIPQHINVSCIQYNSLLGLCRKIVFAVITHFLRDNKVDRIKQTTLLKFVAVFNRNQIRNDISCELSGRWFIWNIKVYFLPEIPCACLKLLVVRNLNNFLHRPTMQDAHIFSINTVKSWLFEVPGTAGILSNNR